jgi:hypothetical protein
VSKTRQEIFDIAYRGLASQGFWPSTDEDGDNCRYRGVDGKRCAIGWCIPDKAYRSVMENNTPSAANPIGKIICQAAGIADDDRMWADRLQAAHDVSISPETMKARLLIFAGEYGLTIPEVSP